MSRLTRYIAVQFFMATISVIALCALLIFLIDFVEVLRQGSKSKAGLTSVLSITILRLPAYIELLLPFAVLVGSIGALLLLARRSELAVMRAGGMSAWQFILPGLIVSGVLGTLSTTLYNPLAAAARDKSEQIFAETFARDGNVLRSGSAGNWLRQDSVDGPSVLTAAAASNGGTALKAVSVFVYDRKGEFSERVDAAEARLSQGYWTLKNATVSRAGKQPQTYDTYMLATYLSPERVADALGNLIAVSFWELPNLIEVAEKAGLSTHRLRVQQQMLLARPLMCVAMVFLAATVSLRSFRSGGIQTKVIIGMTGGFGFFLFAEVSRQVGSAGLAPAWAAIWIPVITATLVAITVLLHQEDG